MAEGIFSKNMLGIVGIHRRAFLYVVGIGCHSYVLNDCRLKRSISELNVIFLKKYGVGARF